jgi:uncharacterized membrane-anchored protein
MNDSTQKAAASPRGPLGIAGHRLLPQIQGEVHARPFQLLETPRTIVQLAFLVEPGTLAAHIAALSRIVEARGGTPPGPDARHLTIEWGKGRLRWERHTEFTKWTYDAPANGELGDSLKGHPFGETFTPPGPVIAAARLDLLPADARDATLAFFDPTSLCLSSVDGGQAEAVSDFRQDADGLTRIVVLDHGLGPARAGALTQRLLEIETYRTLALLGLPEAQRLAPQLGHIESELSRITEALQKGTAASRTLLDELIALSAELEADAVATLSRFGASRAYEEIVTQRLAVLNETPVPGYELWKSFLQRRIGPAMRNCRAVQNRQESLSAKLARSADLLRTRVDVELEQQNRDLLSSMNRRAKLQLRLQQTVEGLSIAAVSYYVVGLVSYVAHGVEETGVELNPGIVVASAVPMALLVVGLIVYRIRRHKE